MILCAGCLTLLPAMGTAQTPLSLRDAVMLAVRHDSRAARSEA